MAASDCLGLEITELRLGLPGGGSRVHHVDMIKNVKKRAFSEIEGDNEEMPEQKNQVVGWPPVCSYRGKKSFNGRNENSKKVMYLKVSMDGAPYLRKIDLSAYKDYSDLLLALEKLFGCYGIGEALNDEDSSDYVPIYEDKDGDWMLVGDVPWNMFIESCKRLRIMKKTEAKGIGLHAKGFLKPT